MDTGGVSGNCIDEKSSLESGGGSHQHHLIFHQVPRIFMLFAVATVALLVLYHSANPFEFSSSSFNPSRARGNPSSLVTKNVTLEEVLKKASTTDNTVILTTLNEAWAVPNSIFDLFLESFRIGNETLKLLNHLVIIALDEKAYTLCLKMHTHCYDLTNNGTDDFSGEAYFMTGDYLKMMWRRIDFLGTVLDLGYNFIFTDTDIMWFRDPFPVFYDDADFQIACDSFNGNPSDLNNMPNGGFTYVKSNNRSRKFYKFWYKSRETYPGLHDQDVLNRIKRDPYITSIGLRIKFLDTAYLGGFCQPSKDLDLVRTMHANCCVGLQNKIFDLKILLDDWRRYLSSVNGSAATRSSWTVPQRCGLKSFHSRDSPKKRSKQGSHPDQVNVHSFVHNL